MIKVFIGYDHAEAVAFNVLSHSIQARASEPVAIIPLRLSQLKPYFKRDRDPTQSNDFSFTRFLVPFLCGYQDYAIFMDCDILCLDDIAKLWAMRDSRLAVQCVKHDHRPRETIKYLGRQQTIYEKKNWSSVMLFNNSLCRALTPKYVEKASGLDLHQFKWLQDDSLLGGLPKEWNHLVGYDAPNKDAKLVHYTTGGPYFTEYRDCEFSKEWFKEYADMINCEQRLVLHKSEAVEV